MIPVVLFSLVAAFMSQTLQAQPLEPAANQLTEPAPPAVNLPPIPIFVDPRDMEKDLSSHQSVSADPRAKVIQDLSVPTEVPSKISMILDSSGSMGQILDKNQTKMFYMKKLMKGFLSYQWKLKNEIGVRIYGARLKGSCDDIELRVPYSDRSLAGLERALEGMSSVGMTPLHRSLEQTFEGIKNMKGPHKVVIVTDGEDTCGGDPCKTAEKIKDQKLDVTFYVIALGFMGQSDKLQKMKCLGDVSVADNEESFDEALNQVSKKMSGSDNLRVVSPNPDSAVYLYRIEKNEKKLYRVFYAKQEQYVEPGKYEAVVGLSPLYKFGQFEILPKRKVTLKVEGEGKIRVNFFGRHLKVQLLDKDNKVVLKGRSDEDIKAPIGKWRLRIYKDPFFENILPDYFVYPNGDHQNDIAGLGVFRVEHPGLKGLYVYDQAGEVLGHDLTGNHIVIKSGYFNLHVDETCTFPKTEIRDKKEVLVLSCSR